MRFSTLRSLIEQFKIEASVDGFDIYPGPDDPRVPTSYILLTAYEGPGLNTDDLFDAQSWQIKVVGEQYNYESGESVSGLLDRYLRRLHSGWYGGQWVTSIYRSGGSPSPLLVDDANRTHFVCSFIVDVDSMAG